MQVQSEVQERYMGALGRLSARLEEDYYVLAAVLYGSLARGEAWERSDIDMMIILRDGQERANREVWLVEDDINISASVVTRGEFKRMLEGTLQGSMLHSIRSQSRLLFCKDDSITQWLSESSQVGARDQAYSLLIAAASLPWQLDKAHKWYQVKQDMNYCFVWVMMAVNSLARLEVILNGQAPGREALDQALKLNPAFFGSVYIDLIHGPKNEQTLGSALEQIEDYLRARVDLLFSPILDFLAQAGGPVPLSEMSQYFAKKLKGYELGGLYEWLAREGIIHKLSSPFQLTRKSQVPLEEPAYYYDTPDISDWEN
jgi:uncharacterized protein